eukprot:COSAG01_NODE_49462_length_372_cov_0.571429_1_plen_124_part_11
MSERGWDFSDNLIAALVPPLAGTVYGKLNVTAHALLLTSFATLQTYTDRNGLEPLPPWKINYPTYPSIFPNAMALFIWREMNGDFHYPLLDILTKNPKAQATSQEWESAIERALLRDYESTLAD